MKVFLILTLVSLLGFGLTFFYAENIILAFVISYVSLLLSASIIWRIDFDTWNCFK